MKRFLAIALLFAACQTSRPAGEQPLAAVDSSRDLIARRDHFDGERSIIRIRTMNGTNSQSARAQLQVGKGGDMLITVFAPLINVAAIRLYAANGQIVFVNDIDRTAWQGSASDFTGSFGFIGSNPSALALLIL